MEICLINDLVSEICCSKSFCFFAKISFSERILDIEVLETDVEGLDEVGLELDLGATVRIVSEINESARASKLTALCVTESDDKR